jgi:hypothetical protein
MRIAALLPVTRNSFSLTKVLFEVKHLAMVVLPLVFAGGAAGQGTVIFWNHDTDSSVEATISGTGAQGTTPAGGAGWGGVITSPSGIWRLTASDWASYISGPPTFVINHDGSLVFLPPTSADRNDLGGPSESFFNSATNSGTRFQWQPSGWAGGETLLITSTPDINDRSTWTWILDYQASGPPLSGTPEPGVFSFGVLAAAALAARARRRRQG